MHDVFGWLRTGRVPKKLRTTRPGLTQTGASGAQLLLTILEPTYIAGAFFWARFFKPLMPFPLF